MHPERVNRRQGLVGVIAAMAVVNLVYGITFPLLALVLDGQGVSKTLIGLSTMSQAAAILLFVARGHRLEHAEEEAEQGIWSVFLLAPTIMLANLAYAASAESLITFFPLFGIKVGISEHFALWLMTMIGMGSMVLILPLGWLADHVNRKGLLVACIVLTMAGLVIMPYVLLQPFMAQLFAFFFGGVEGMIYALGVILIGERFKGSMLAAASTTFTACWAAGTVIGPFLVGGAWIVSVRSA